MQNARHSEPVLQVVGAICAAVFAVGVATNLPVPLYRTYGALSGGSDVAVSVAFACYGFGVLPSLFFFGAISDRTGRRFTLQCAVLFSMLSILTIILFPGVLGLGVSRLLQGIAIGLSGASATAFLAETLNGAQGTVRAAGYVTAMLPLGFGVGGLSTGLCLLPGPTLVPWSYLVFLGASALCLHFLQQFKNTALAQHTALLRIPYYPRNAVPFCWAIGAQWCLVGVVLSTIPVQLSYHHVPSWAGMTSFFLPVAGLLCQPIARKLQPTGAVRVGLVLAPIGCLLLTAGISVDRIWLVLLGAAVSGTAAIGFSFQGGLAGVALSSRNDKARGAAGFFLACYTGLSFAPPVLSFLSGEGGVVSGLTGLTVFMAVASFTTEMGFRLVNRRPMVAAAE